MYDKVVELAQKLFGAEHPISVFFSKLSKKKFKNLAAEFKGNDDLLNFNSHSVWLKCIVVRMLRHIAMS